MSDKNETGINTLLDAILKIPGDKIITLTLAEEQPFTIDCSEKGIFGNGKNDEAMFRKKLSYAFKNMGAMVLRQILHLKTEREMPNGERVWVPKKNVYGILIMNGIWRPIPKEEMKQAHSVDAATGTPLPPEKDVYFHDFPVSK